MKNLSKKLLVTVILLSSLFYTNVFVHAQSSIGGVTDPTPAANQTPAKTDSSSGIFTLKNPLKVNTVGEVINAFLEIITYLLIILAVLAFIWTGFLFVYNASTGNSSKLSELKSRLLYIIIGVAIVIGARIIIQVVINTIAATGTVDQKVIESARNAAQGK